MKVWGFIACVMITALAIVSVVDLAGVVGGIEGGRQVVMIELPITRGEV